MLTLRHDNSLHHSFDAINNSEIAVLPYTKISDSYNIEDFHLAQLYRRIVRERSVSKVFYDGCVQKTSDFIQFFKSDKHEVFIVNFMGQEAGFFWLTPFMKRSTFLNYCFYRDFWGKKSLSISKWIINKILEMKNGHDEHVFDVVLGITPANNALAIKFLKKIGMSVIGEIPELIHPHNQRTNIAGVLSHISRNKKNKLSPVKANLRHLFS